MGLQLLGESAWFSFGTNARKFALRDDNILPAFLESSTILHTPSLMTSYQCLKKYVVKPSGPGALHVGILMTASSTSWGSMGHIWLSFWSLETKQGMLLVIRVIASSLFGFGLLMRFWKWLVSSFAISLCSLTFWPYPITRWVILLCNLRWMRERWKNLVFFSPSLS